tara:strand:+ start:103 stop:606 length:504 start_codon:yes stop_codon:yes gene_type:complete
MENINNKLKQIITHSELDIKTFSKLLMCDYVEMKRMLEGVDEISFNFIKKIIKTFDEVNPNWLMLNTGPIFLKPFDKKKYVGSRKKITKLDENKILNDITKRLIQVRNMLGQNQTEFASNLEVKRQKIVAVESFRNGPSIFIIYNIHLKYNISLKWLFFGEGSVLDN